MTQHLPDPRLRSTAAVAGHPIHTMLVPFPIALYGATLAGIIEAWNPGAVALMGYTEQEAAGQHISMLAFPGCRPSCIRH